MSIRDAYTNWAASYDSDRNLTRDLDWIVTKNMLSHRHCQSILELGCGTGKNTALLAGIGEHVCALDFSVGMLRQARGKLHLDNVAFVVADLTRPFPCTDHGVDLVVCNLVLEPITDLGFVFSEAYRVLAQGGRFFVSELHPFKQYQGAKPTFRREEARTDIPAFVHHISDFWEAAEQAGFTLRSLREWWHQDDLPLSPRLVSFLFEK